MELLVPVAATADALDVCGVWQHGWSYPIAVLALTCDTRCL